MRVVWIAAPFFIIASFVLAIQSNMFENSVSFNYSEKLIEKKELKCEKFIINSTAQKLIDYEILYFYPNITIRNVFGDNTTFYFRLLSPEFENDLIKEMNKKPFAIYYRYGCHSSGYCTWYEKYLHFPPKIEISPEWVERTTSDKEITIPLQIELRLDKDVIFEGWRFNISVPYSIYVETKNGMTYSCNNTIELIFDGKPMEFYLGDFITSVGSLKSPWGDDLYGPKAIERFLPPSIELSNITLSRKTDEIIIKFSTNGMLATCAKSGVIPPDTLHCFEDSLILEQGYVILKDRPDGTILKEYPLQFLEPFVVKADGNEYTLRIPQEIYYGSWYEELWFKGKLRYENSIYNEAYEEPFILARGVGRLWYFR